MTNEVFERHNGPNVVKFLEDYIHKHGGPRNVRLDQARSLMGNKVKIMCKNNNMNIITAPANDHREIGLVEQLKILKNKQLKGDLQQIH